MSERETVLLERPAEGVARLTLNRPEHANGVVPELIAELLVLLRELDADRSVRAVVLTGAGRQFCAGADLRAFKAHLEEELPRSGEPFNVRALAELVETLAGLRPPVIAAVNGAATGGGFDLALACDLRIAAATAKLGQTYVDVGLTSASGGGYFLPRIVGMGRAAEIALSGAPLDAERALELGVVNRVVEPEELPEAALGLAVELAAKPRRAVEATKAALRASWSTDLPGSLETGYETVAALQREPDVREAIDAFLERRPPRFDREPGEGQER